MSGVRMAFATAYDGKPVIRLSPETKEQALLASGLGFVLQPSGYMDLTDSRIAHRAVAFHDQGDEAVKAYLAPSKALYDASWTVKPLQGGIEIPSAKGITLDGYQIAAAQQAATRKTSLMAHGVGLGKSCAALSVVNALRLQRVLICCPAFLVANFIRECQKFLIGYHKIIPIKNAKTQIKDGAGIYILPASRVVPYFMAVKRAQPFDLLIIDESTYYKNDKEKNECSARTRAMWGDLPSYSGICSCARQVISLSATPSSYPTEMYRQLEAVAPQVLNGRDMATFRDQTLNTVATAYGGKVVGAKDPLAFSLDLRATGYMIRPRREEALPASQLNESKWLSVALSPSGQTKKLMDEENSLFKAWGGSFENIPGVESDHIMSIRREIEMAKINDIVAYCMQLLQDQDRLFVACLHRDVVTGVVEKLRKRKVNANAVMGGMNASAKDDILQKFASRRLGKRVIVGQLHSVFVGLNELVVASHLVVTGVPWRHWELTQLTGRLDRRTQEADMVFFHLLMYPGSLEERILKGVGVSKQIANEVFDN